MRIACKIFSLNALALTLATVSAFNVDFLHAAAATEDSQNDADTESRRLPMRYSPGPARGPGPRMSPGPGRGGGKGRGKGGGKGGGGKRGGGKGGGGKKGGSGGGKKGGHGPGGYGPGGYGPGGYGPGGYGPGGYGPGGYGPGGYGPGKGGGRCQAVDFVQLDYFQDPADFAFDRFGNFDDTLLAGSTYIWDCELFDPTNTSLIIGTTFGQCTRVRDANDLQFPDGSPSGGYCTFTYGDFNNNTVTVTGLIEDTTIRSLAVTGGTGDWVGAYGETLLRPVYNVTSASFFADVFDDVVGYLGELSFAVPRPCIH